VIIKYLEIYCLQEFIYFFLKLFSEIQVHFLRGGTRYVAKYSTQFVSYSTKYRKEKVDNIQDKH
jgi:CRISPR/Cas system-associated endonuclease Cas1